MKIFIAVPTFENIYPDTYKSIYGLDPAGHWLVFDFIRGYDCAEARNRIANQAITEKADYVLMVDNDIVLPSDAIAHLMDDPKDVCLGLYAHRGDSNLYDGKVCVYKPGEFNYETLFTAKEMQELREQGQNKVLIHGGGMGCALIKTDVFQRLEYPFFNWTLYANGQYLSEDLYFCEQLKNHSIFMFADTRVTCGHMMRRVQWPD